MAVEIRMNWFALLCLVAGLALASSPGIGQITPAQPIRISVDATQAPQKILHASLQIPASPGPLTLYYPKWLPADHSPDGPISNLAGLRFTAQGKQIPWRQDDVDMYSFHLDVPQGADLVDVSLDFLLSAPGATIDFSASGSSNLLILMWHEVLLYPAGRPANQITFQPTLRLPPGWKFSTSLPVSSQSGNSITFAPVPLDLLVDSPVQSGEFTKVIPLTSGGKLSHELDVVADDAWALDIPPALIENYKRLVAEASALYQSHHYRDYHFLLTLSDNTIGLGQEHHESSDDRVPERTLVDPAKRLLEAGLFPHEFTHSWNGQFRRPEGLATSDFQQPMKGDLLWVYEGLTTYLGTILTARSGLWSPAETRESLATVASTLDHRKGRAWRSLQNTANAAQVLYFAPKEWTSYRRSTDFYEESVLIWLEADVKIRKQTEGKRSLDDFCRAFLGGPDVMPVIKTYTFDDLVTAMNAIAPSDWLAFFRERLQSVDPHAPLGGITDGGWRVVYNDEPNVMIEADQEASGNGDFTSSIGLVVKSDGSILDAVPGMPANDGGLSPYMKIVGVNSRQFSVDTLKRALQDAMSNSRPIQVLVSNTGSFETHDIVYHYGLRYPHLERIDGTSDYLDDILKPLASNLPAH
ncbi:MAG: M61 family metallopeptidase [Terriglobales bacterium]